MNLQALGEFYAEQGYVSGIRVFNSSETASFRAYFDDLVGTVGQDASAKDIQNSHFHDEQVWRMATTPRLLDVVEALLGPDLLLVNTRFICKFPDKDGLNFYTWHQDVPFWGIGPPIGCFCSIALDSSSRENGCLKVIPKSYRMGMLPHHRAEQAVGNMLRMHQELPLQVIDENEAIYLELKPGEMSVHDSRTFHASDGNMSNNRRCVFICTFVPTFVRQSKEYVFAGDVNDYEYRDWEVVLVRGEDRYGHFRRIPIPFALEATVKN